MKTFLFLVAFISFFSCTNQKQETSDSKKTDSTLFYTQKIIELSKQTGNDMLPFEHLKYLMNDSPVVKNLSGVLKNLIAQKKYDDGELMRINEPDISPAHPLKYDCIRFRWNPGWIGYSISVRIENKADKPEIIFKKYLHFSGAKDSIVAESVKSISLTQWNSIKDELGKCSFWIIRDNPKDGCYDCNILTVEACRYFHFGDETKFHKINEYGGASNLVDLLQTIMKMMGKDFRKEIEIKN